MILIHLAIVCGELRVVFDEALPPSNVTRPQLGNPDGVENSEQPPVDTGARRKLRAPFERANTG